MLGCGLIEGNNNDELSKDEGLLLELGLLESDLPLLKGYGSAPQFLSANTGKFSVNGD